MLFSGMRFSAVAVVAAALLFPALPAVAQNGDSKGNEQRPQGPSEGTKETQKKVDELAEAAAVLSGAAGHPECAWLGHRVVGLLWRDDLDTAFRHLELYDRFGCPGGHIQASFRCVVQQGNIDPKVPESLNGRVHACWLNPSNPAPPPTASASASGTTSR
jgi:hypothetical protein